MVKEDYQKCLLKRNTLVELRKFRNFMMTRSLRNCLIAVKGLIEGGDGGCEACGDIKFVPCKTCYGSCKTYYEDDYEEDDNCEVGG
ncbi:hypothetical protein MtrunA17_Chr4g0060701 [Medicago truncatula]|uniref:Uncharacterized protein n=1 Tax=Medicago truncatula TaxID=3880 RepID=A0A396IFT1_MEDTR|nr:hypothetical protein MtrunA17_Chr4g0060701 [Medicago truncatula]